MKDLVEATAREAGQLLLTYFRKPDLKVETKKDGSLVTEADFAASRLIQSRLESLGYPVVSEEDIPATREGDCYFIVDPLDGTKYFANGETSFATLIGFVSGNRPILGVAYFPELDLFFSAETGKGCFLNGKKMFNEPSAKPIVAYSSGFHRKSQAQEILKKLNVGEIKEEGSVLKLCRMAQGLADFYPRFGPTSEWDTGACQVIMEEAGCSLWDLKDLRPLEYGKEGYINAGFVAFRNDLQTKVVEIFKDLQWKKGPL
jgi:3'(2'), 5'-bisphosphate nucleotidase